MIQYWTTRTVTSRLQLDNGLVIESHGPALPTLSNCTLMVNWSEVEKPHLKTGDSCTLPEHCGSTELEIMLIATMFLADSFISLTCFQKCCLHSL